MTVGIVDLIILGIIIVSVLFALYRGLVRELLGITSWLLAGFAALYSYDPFMKLCEGRFENVKLSAITFSVLLALIVLIIMTVFNAFITKRLRKSSLSGLDRIFGFIFGIARALLIVTLVYIFAATLMLSPKYVEKLKAENFSVSYVEMMADYVQNIFPDNIRSDLKTYQVKSKQKLEKHQKIQSEAQKAVVDYDAKERQSLDDMIENIVEIGEIEE